MHTVPVRFSNWGPKSTAECYATACFNLHKSMFYNFWSYEKQYKTQSSNILQFQYLLLQSRSTKSVTVTRRRKDWRKTRKTAMLKYVFRCLLELGF